MNSNHTTQPDSEAIQYEKGQLLRPKTKSHKRFTNFKSFDTSAANAAPQNYELSLKEPQTPSIFD